MVPSEPQVAEDSDDSRKRLRVFLSYAAAQHSIAEAVHLRLIDMGLSVFFDRTQLRPGETFDRRISDEIQTSDILIFLISPESIRQGAYTRTELAIARETWPNPSKRILPVLVSPVEFALIPEYLKAVTILRPEGNIVADIVEALRGLLRATGHEQSIAQTLDAIEVIEHEQERQWKSAATARIDAAWKQEQEKYRITVNGQKTQFFISRDLAFLPLVAGLALAGWGYAAFTSQDAEFFGWLPTIGPIAIGTLAAITVWRQASKYDDAKRRYLMQRESVGKNAADDPITFLHNLERNDGNHIR